MNSVSAIIPARGGSKGIPNKNLAPCAGMPLLYWSIAAARLAGIESVIVSTDDEDIATVANSFGASSLMRPDVLATDEAPLDPVIAHALGVMGSGRPQITVLLQPTSPLRMPAWISQAVVAVALGETDSVFSAFPLYPYVWTYNLKHTNLNIKKRRNRQDHSPMWVETGSIYAFRSDAFLEAEHRHPGPRRSIVVVDNMLEVDDPDDLAEAEWKLNRVYAKLLGK